MASGSRGVFFAAAACSGAAVGMIAYRFGVLPILWSSSASWLFPGVAMGLGFGAQAMLKNQTATRPPLALLIVTGAVALAAAMGAAFLIVPPLGYATLTTTQLPGFTVDLPAGTTKDTSPNYALGKHTLHDVGGTSSRISIEWTGGEASREDLEAALHALGPAMGVDVTGTKASEIPGPAGTRVYSASFESDKGEIRFTQVSCGKRVLTVLTLGSTGIDRLHRRIVTSIACRPDAAKEELAPGLVPLVVGLPGWYALERLPQQVSLTDGDAFLMLRSTPTRDLTLDAVDKLMPGVFQAMGGTIASAKRVADRIDVTGTIEGEHVDGWARVVRCPDAGILMLALTSDRASADRIAELATTARCTRADEAPPTWPDAPADAPAATD